MADSYVASNVLDISEGVDGWHNGWEHQLVGWDDSRVAAIYSQQGGSQGGYARMITVADDGTLSAGTAVQYYVDGEDPESIYNYTNDAIKVGNLLVQWRRDSDRLLTLEYDDATDAFVKVGAQDAPTLTFGGGRLVWWTDDTMLMVSERSFDSDPTTLTLAQWDGTQWQYGVTSRFADSTGGGDYMQAAPIAFAGAESAAVLATSPTDDREHWSYVLVTGTYPGALTTHISTAASGRFRYYNREMFAMPTTGKVLRMVPLVPGTLTPMTGGGDLDYGITELSVVDGEVVESPITSLSPSDSWYDIAMTETTDGQPWAVYEIEATGTIYPVGTLGVQPVGVGPETRVTDETPDELGISPNDVDMRTMAPAGVWAVAGWMTNWNRIFRVQAFGFPAPFGRISGAYLGSDRRFM